MREKSHESKPTVILIRKEETHTWEYRNILVVLSIYMLTTFFEPSSISPCATNTKSGFIARRRITNEKHRLVEKKLHLCPYLDFTLVKDIDKRESLIDEAAAINFLFCLLQTKTRNDQIS